MITIKHHGDSTEIYLPVVKRKEPKKNRGQSYTIHFAMTKPSVETLVEGPIQIPQEMQRRYKKRSALSQSQDFRTNPNIPTLTRNLSKVSDVGPEEEDRQSTIRPSGFASL